jgi:hypothetical protein
VHRTQPQYSALRIQEIALPSTREANKSIQFGHPIADESGRFTEPSFRGYIRKQHNELVPTMEALAQGSPYQDLAPFFSNALHVYNFGRLDLRRDYGMQTHCVSIMFAGFAEPRTI